MTDINQAFRQHEILLTGGNGFLGKVVLGLLLDRFPNFKHLHILIRPHHTVSAEDRFYCETLASPALAPIAEKRGKEFLHHRITVWPGDVGRTNCGIDPNSLEKLVRRVGVIINCAGRVDFFPPVNESFRSNVDGVEHLVAVAKSLSARLLHVSTCYVCGVGDGLVEETEPILGFYPHRRGPDDRSFQHAQELRYCRERIRQIYDSAGASHKLGVEWTEQQSAELVERLVALGRQRAEHWGWVNTYTYAKSLGEQIIAAEPGLDYTIVRPAIVESALRFPFPGWIEGGRTAAPLVLMALGGLKDWPVQSDAPLEVVPVDLVASAILVVGALLLQGRHHHVYQLGTADVNPIELGKLVVLLDAQSRKRSRTNGYPSFAHAFLGRIVGVRQNAPFRIVSAGQAKARRVHLQKRINRVEALVARTGRMLEKSGLPGRESLAGWTTTLRTLGLQAKFREQTLEQYLPFILDNRFIFESENIRKAYSLISETDRRLLPWDPEQINWTDYWVRHQIDGIAKWVQPEAVKGWSFRI